MGQRMILHDGDTCPPSRAWVTVLSRRWDWHGGQKGTEVGERAFSPYLDSPSDNYRVISYQSAPTVKTVSSG